MKCKGAFALTSDPTPTPRQSILDSRMGKSHVSKEKTQPLRAECPNIAINTEWEAVLFAALKQRGWHSEKKTDRNLGKVA